MTLPYTEEGIIRFVKPEGVIHWKGYHAWQIWSNHAWRDTDLVTSKGGRFLFCYWMPNGNHYYSEVGINTQTSSKDVGI
jgi:hypothetical protein